MRSKSARRGALGAQCKRCGADDWYKRPSGRACAPCNSRRIAERVAANPEKYRAYERKWHKDLRVIDPARPLVGSARGRAKTKGVPFSITVDYVRGLWPAEDKCPACGVTMRSVEDNAKPSSPSLDRVLPSLGYVPGNVAVICMGCNRAKNTYSVEQLERLVEWLRGAEAEQAFYGVEVA